MQNRRNLIIYLFSFHLLASQYDVGLSVPSKTEIIEADRKIAVHTYLFVDPGVPHRGEYRNYWTDEGESRWKSAELAKSVYISRHRVRTDTS